jgi:hypothetical protein
MTEEEINERNRKKAEKKVKDGIFRTKLREMVDNVNHLQNSADQIRVREEAKRLAEATKEADRKKKEMELRMMMLKRKR